MEKKLQQKIAKLCKDHAMICYKVHAEGVVGFPDLFIAGSGRVVLVECKHPGKTGLLRPGQKRRIAELREAQVEVYVIDDYEEAKKLIEGWVE